MNYNSIFDQFRESSLQGRYITLDTIEPLLHKHNLDNQLKICSQSVLGKPIYSYQIGSGKLKILIWSQMHGNESTTTKGLLDFINFLNSESEIAKKLVTNFTFCCLPMLNPDGAELYTRVNANQIDLNRDSQQLTQPESKIIREVFDTFSPDYCFNLHDQRTIFGVGDTGKTATLSFLAPAYNEEREINDSRLKAINLIAAVNEVLQAYLPGQVGRFDDSFNINCIGDMFQHLGVPTILLEAGHFQNDYEREETRKYVFIALLSSFAVLFENDIVDNGIEKYLSICQNKVVFYDFIYKNIKINYDGNEIITNFAAQYKEELVENKIQFNAYIVKVGELESYFGHYEYDGKKALFKDQIGNFPRVNEKANFFLDSHIEFLNGAVID